MKQKQQRFLEALLTESTVTSAIRVSGITRGTAYSYLKDEKFKEELQKRRNQCLDDVIRYMQGKLSACTEELMKIIESPETAPQVKVNAITTVFNCYKTMSEANIIARLDRLEMLSEGHFEE